MSYKNGLYNVCTIFFGNNKIVLCNYGSLFLPLKNKNVINGDFLSHNCEFTLYRPNSQLRVVMSEL